MSNTVVSVWEDLARQGWAFTEEPQAVGSTRTLERNGLRFSYDPHWSVQQYFVSSTAGGWGDLQQIMGRVGLPTHRNDADLVEAAANADAIKRYLNSWRWKLDVRASRRKGMENLREFERSIGVEQSWLAGEEDHLRWRSEQKEKLSGSGVWKLWGAAGIATAYLCYKLAVAEDTLRFATAIGAGFAILFSGLIALRLQKKI